MRQLAFKKHLKILKKLFALEAMSRFQYRVNFVVVFFASTIWLIAEIMFIHFLLQRYDNIAGWSFYEMGLLFGVNQIWVGLAYYFFIWPSSIYFTRLVNSGKLDKVLTYPMNTRVYLSFTKIDYTSLTIFITGISLLLISVNKLNINLSLSRTVLAFFMILLICFIIYSFQFLFASLSFWVSKGGSYLYIISAVDRLGRYPYEIFSKNVLFVLFTFVVPITISSNVPARAILGILEFRFIIYTLIVSISTFLVSQGVWMIGIRRYESASS